MSLRTPPPVGGIKVTPENIAEAFWEMASDEMADFFTELERIAGGKLCLQMAAVVREIQERADKGDRQAQQGFQTMLSHAQAYVESATDYRVWGAQREIQRMTKAALSQPATQQGES